MPIIQAIFEHSGSPVKMEVVSALKAAAEREPTPEEQAAQRAQLLLPIRSVEKLEAEIMKIVSESNLKDAQAEKVEEETENIDFDGDIAEMTATLEVQDRVNASVAPARHHGGAQRDPAGTGQDSRKGAEAKTVLGG
jgi:hypothetical protein